MVEIEGFLRLFQALEREQVAYVLVGGLAMFAQGLPRATKDIDLFVQATPDNISRLKAALHSVYDDACIDDIDVADVAPPDGGVIRYGPPTGDYLIDILGRLGEAWCYEDLEWETLDVLGVPVRVATPKTLYRMKHDTVRLQDRADAAALARKFDLEEA